MTRCTTCVISNAGRCGRSNTSAINANSNGLISKCFENHINHAAIRSRAFWERTAKFETDIFINENQD